MSPWVHLTFAVEDRNPNLGSVAYQGPKGSFGQALRFQTSPSAGASRRRLRVSRTGALSGQARSSLSLCLRLRCGQSRPLGSDCDISVHP